MARIWRQGQKKPCFIYRLLSTGTLEESIYQRQTIKTGLSRDLMNDVGEVDGKGNDVFTAEELRALFKLHLDTACHTHDLLGCSCLTDDPNGPRQADSDDSDDDDLPDLTLGFTAASQFVPKSPVGHAFSL